MRPQQKELFRDILVLTEYYGEYYWRDRIRAEKIRDKADLLIEMRKGFRRKIKEAARELK